jgi:Mg/Co/Ni transporter MgtE
MSPRAAWQLEALGFSDVYDYVEGKLDWISKGCRTEGTHHHAVVGEVADRQAVVTCRVGERSFDVGERLRSTAHTYCVVLNDDDVVLGRLRTSHLQSDLGAPVLHVMQPGPTTVRPTESAEASLGWMRRRRVRAVLVTTKRGRLVGVVTQESVRRLLDEPDQRPFR